jgi:small conductance mechanosensitive channel
MNGHLLFSAIVSLLLSVSMPAALAQESIAKPELDKSMLLIEDSIAKLKLLERQIRDTSGADREALVFRFDQRIIRLMDNATKLTRNIATLPQDDPDRLALEKRFRDGMAGFDLLLFKRIDDLEARITANREKESAVTGSDPEMYVLQAYVNSLEVIRLSYYAALVGLIQSKDILGMPGEELRLRTEALLYQYAERVSGRIELFSNSLREVKARLTLDSANAALQSAANEISMVRTIEIRRLEAVLDLMARLEIDTVTYRAVLLRENKVVSLQLLDVQAVKRMLQDGWEESRESLGKNLPDLLLKLLVFLLILFIFRALSRLVRRITRSTLSRSSADLSNLLKDILVSASGALVMLVGVLVALSQVGISLGPALAGLGVAGFILGFALQDTLGNFAAGAMILIYRPYDVDDFVEVAGTAGLVKKMNLVSTTIITFDNQTLIIPNSKIWGDVIKNVTAQNTRRVDLEFGISYGDDIEKAERVLREIVAAHTKVLADPEPNIRVHKLGDSSVNFVVRPWTNTADYWDVYWDITREVKLRFDREGISIPFPQRDVHLHQRAEPV